MVDSLGISWLFGGPEALALPRTLKPGVVQLRVPTVPAGLVVGHQALVWSWRGPVKQGKGALVGMGSIATIDDGSRVVRINLERLLWWDQEYCKRNGLGKLVMRGREARRVPSETAAAVHGLSARTSAQPSGRQPVNLHQLAESKKQRAGRGGGSRRTHFGASQPFVPGRGKNW